MEHDADNAEAGMALADRALSERALAERAGTTDGEEVVVLTPAGRGGHPRARGLRVTGPGRREREYLERVDVLSTVLDATRAELERAALVERGTGRLADRLERELAAGREREREVGQQLHRVLVALGSTQRELEEVRARLARAEARQITDGSELAARRRPGWLARVTHWLRSGPTSAHGSATRRLTSP